MNFSGPLQMVGHEVPAVVAVLCESIAGPHQLIAAKKTQPAQSNKRKKKSSFEFCIQYVTRLFEKR